MEQSTKKRVKSAEKPVLSIVIPAYNEGKVIEKTISNAEKAIRYPHEILVVYDFDEDTTVPPVKKLSKEFTSVKLVKNIYGRGALNAIKTGLTKAQGEAVCVMMADLTDDPKTINAMMEKYKEGYHIVSGSRYMKGGKQIGGPFLKQLLSRAAGMSLYYLVRLPTHDATNSFRLYSKQLLNRTKIESFGGFELGIELTVKGYFSGYKVGEVPTTWNFLDKESRFRLFKWLPNYLKWYFLAIVKRLEGYPKVSR